MVGLNYAQLGRNYSKPSPQIRLGAVSELCEVQPEVLFGCRPKGLGSQPSPGTVVPSYIYIYTYISPPKGVWTIAHILLSAIQGSHSLGFLLVGLELGSPGTRNVALLQGALCV